MKTKVISGVNAAWGFVTSFLRGRDENDACVWIGLPLIWYGVSQIYAPAAPIVCGVILLCLGLYGDYQVVKANRGPVE